MKKQDKQDKHDEYSVLKSLSKKNDCKIENGSNIIQLLNGFKQPRKLDLGNGSWGKIDYLVNFCGYITQRVNKFGW